MVHAVASWQTRQRGHRSTHPRASALCARYALLHLWSRKNEQILMGMDVPDDRIHMESFGGAKIEEDLSVKGIPATATVVLDGQTHTVSIAAEQTTLDAACKAGLHPPFSYQFGICGACRATLTKGTVHMRSHPALKNAEIANGCILTCQSVPTTGAIEVGYKS